MSRHNRDRKKRPPKYAGAVVAKARQGKLSPGQVYTMDVRHDAWCDLLKGVGPCNCNPEVRAPERIPSPEEN